MQVTQLILFKSSDSTCILLNKFWGVVKTKLLWDVTVHHWVSSPSHLQSTFFSDCLTLKMKAIRPFKTTHPMTEHYIPEHLNNLTQYKRTGLWTDINVRWASVVSTITRQWVGWPSNQRSIPSSVKKFLSPKQHPDRISSPTSLQLNQYQGSSLRDTVAGTHSWPPTLSSASKYTFSPPTRPHSKYRNITF